MAHKVGHKKNVRKPGESAFTYKGSKTFAKIMNRTTQSRRARQISSAVVPKPKISKASSVREPGTKAVGKATTPAKITGNTYTPKPRKNQKNVRAVISKTPKPVKKQVHPKPSIRPSSKSSSVRPPVEKVSKPITKAKGTSPSNIEQVSVSKHTPKPSKKYKGVSPSGIEQVSVSKYIPPKSSGNKQHQAEDIAQVPTGQKERDPAKVAKSIYRAFFPTFRPEKKSKITTSKPKTTTANMYAKTPGDQHPPAASNRGKIPPSTLAGRKIKGKTGVDSKHTGILDSASKMEAKRNAKPAPRDKNTPNKIVNTPKINSRVMDTSEDPNAVPPPLNTPTNPPKRTQDIDRMNMESKREAQPAAAKPKSLEDRFGQAVSNFFRLPHSFESGVKGTSSYKTKHFKPKKKK